MTQEESALKTYQGFFLWLIGIIFIAGITYYKVDVVSARADIAKERLTVYDARINKVETLVEGMQYQLTYQKEWQKEFMTTFKELVAQIKITNHQVYRNTYQLEVIGMTPPSSNHVPEVINEVN